MRTLRPLRTLALALLAACAPAATAQFHYPGAPTTFDRAKADAKALAIADKVLAAAGGPVAWAHAKQVRWHQAITRDGKVLVEGEEAWDRWSSRHYAKLIREDGDPVVGYSIYGERAIGFLQNGDHHHPMDDDSRAKAVKTAREVWSVHSALLTMPFLLEEPGTTLAYDGALKDDAGAETGDDLKVTFAEPARAGVEFHVIVDRATSLITRVEMVTGTDRTGYKLTDWKAIDGLQIATTRANLGDLTEITKITDVKAGEPDDDLFIAPLY